MPERVSGIFKLMHLMSLIDKQRGNCSYYKTGLRPVSKMVECGKDNVVSFTSYFH